MGVLVFSGVFSLMIPQAQVAADCTNPQQCGATGGTGADATAGSGKWLDDSTIQFCVQADKPDGCTTENFTGPQGCDNGKFCYVATTNPGTCSDTGKQTDYIEFSKDPTSINNPHSPGKVYYFYDGGIDCHSQTANIALTDTSKAVLPLEFSSCGTPGSTGYNSCIQATAQSSCGTQQDPSQKGVPSSYDPNCVPNLLASLQKQQQNGVGAVGSFDTSTGTTPSTDPSSGSDSPELDCSFFGGALNWILCPLLKLVNSALNGLDSAISAMLNVNTDDLFGQNTDTGKTYYKAWQTFEGLAIGLLIIGGLIMVISQALGWEMLDAYTIKKVLPRLIVATIGIALSWELMKWFVGFTNDLGLGVQSLIYYPFKQISANANMLGSGSGLIVTLLLSGAGLGLGFIGILSLGATALLAIFMAFLVLVLRKLVIVVLVLTAPLAIAAYILPNTQSVWKLWHESFSKALLMYPMIMGFIAVGRVLAVTSSGSGATALGQIVGIVAYIIPYFMIPATFRFAGGALRTVGGFVNDRSRGAFDRLKKGRGERIARNTAALKSGSRFNPQSKVTRALGGNVVNRVGSHAGAGLRGRFGFGATGAAARANNVTATADQLAKENHAFAAQMNNEDAMAALAFGGDASKLRQLEHFQGEEGEKKLQAALGAARSIGINRRNMMGASDALAQSGKVIGNNQELGSLLDTVSAGNGALRSGLEGSYRFTSRKVGRADIGRRNAYDSFKELNMGSIGQQKPLAMKGLFGIDENTGRSQFMDAVEHENIGTEERQHMYDVLYAAQGNVYNSAEQQAELAKTINHVTTSADGAEYWERAKKNYGRKMAESRGEDVDLSPGGNAGGPPGSAAAPGT